MLASPLSRRVASFLLVSGALVACGARGPLEDVVIVQAGATADAGASAADASMPQQDIDTGAPTGPGQIFADAGGLLGCGACVTTQCGMQIQMCLQDPACTAALQCIATTCLGVLGGDSGAGSSGGGGANCFLQCASSGLGNLVPILTCITGTCGADCGSLLGGLGQLGGFSAPPGGG